MSILRVLCAGGMTLILACVCALARPAAAKTTDTSDLWWIPAESGWGIQFVQQEDTLFATMFVYGSDGRPTWYTATLDFVDPASFTWNGTLYATTGPWFGTVPFSSAQVTVTPVGKMTFTPLRINQATLTYDVSGVQVVKTIQRQTLVTLNFNGTYAATLAQQGSGTGCTPGRDSPGTPASIQITQSNGAMGIVAKTAADSCTYLGSYTQGGHFGQVSGSYACVSGDSGTFAMAEMAVSWYDFRARTFMSSDTGCTLKGFVSGLRQPPPPQ